MRTSAWLIVAALTLGACTGDDGAGPGHGQLVVTGGDGSVALVDPSDGSREVLTAGPSGGPVVQPTASPDGSRVVWSEIGPDGAVVVVHEEGELARVAAPAAPFFYLFAPAGDLLAALGNDPGGDGVALMMIDLGANSAEIIDAGQPYYMDWYPDGERLAAHIGADVLATVAADGRQTLDMTPGPFQAPQVTADGRVLAVVASDVLTASVVDGVTAQLGGGTLGFIGDGGQVGDAVATTSSLVSFEMAAQGDRVAFVDGVGPGGTALGPLVVVAVDGSDPVTVAEERIVAFEWSPSGDRLLFLTADRREGLVPGVWDGAAVADYPAFLPTGVFLTQYLPFWSQYTRSITQWAPDGGAFSYAGVGDDGSGTVWIQPLDGERREVGEGEMVTWASG